MRVLMRLYYLKLKGNIRNIFSKPSSAIFAIIIILIYGGLFVSILTRPNIALTMVNIKDINTPIFIGIGFTALMTAIILLQKRKSLFMENDAFYLFAGPFKRSQIMQFVMSQTFMGAFMSGAISLFMMVLYGGNLGYDFFFLALTFLTHSMTYFFFTVLYNYIYLLSIKNKKYDKLSWIVLGIFLLIIIVIFFLVSQSNGLFTKNSFMAFLNSDLFYSVPLFGWIKLVLVSYVAGNGVMILMGMALLAIACGIIYILMCSYKGEFIERAMEDAIAYTARFNEIKAGNKTSFNDKKTHDVKSNFKEGAKAIYSKNMLIMRKSNDFVGFQDFFLMSIYLVVALVMNLGFDIFMIMVVFSLFINVQNLTFMKEMNYYQIYLIPDKPLKKLWYLIVPSYMKMLIVVTLPTILSIIIFQVSILKGIQYYILTLGYAALFLSATVLSVRILKSRNNPIMENMLRMLIIGIASMPSILFVLIFIIVTGTLTSTLFTVMSWISLLMNFALSALIIFGCRNMMNGREITSE